MAAVPMVLAGIAVAIICAGMDQKGSADSEKLIEQHIATGAALGLLFGVCLNNSGLWEDNTLGYALGPLWGMALATLFDKCDKRKQK